MTKRKTHNNNFFEYFQQRPFVAQKVSTFYIFEKEIISKQCDKLRKYYYEKVS